jgi:hypothetical protein
MIGDGDDDDGVVQAKSKFTNFYLKKKVCFILNLRNNSLLVKFSCYIIKISTFMHLY